MVARVGALLSVLGAFGFAALSARADFYSPDAYPIGTAASAMGMAISRVLSANVIHGVSDS